MQYVGHVTFELVYDHGDSYTIEQTFETADQLFHYTSFTFLHNMQEKYQIDEVRVAEVYIQGLTYQETRDVVQRFDDIDQPLADFRLYGRDDRPIYGT